MTSIYALPAFSLRFYPIWRRNFLVWKKLMVASVLGNIADPLITLIAFGYGLGSMLKEVDGIPYIHYLASGSICMSVMMASSFEALYSAYSRMSVQRTWDALMNAPLALDDIVLAELLWSATKSLFSGVAILCVMFALGIGLHPQVLLVLPLLFFAGMTFAALGLIMNALARGYDFFTYYFTLILTPMVFLSGVYYPVAQLPSWLQLVSQFLPLSAAVNLVRPLVLGGWPQSPLLDLAILAAYCCGGFYAAMIFTRRRF
ncbi:ABC-2 type transporter, NodJ family [Herbaspirillum sp. CF444]|uniref:ABC transporter permease n=1 Tax=Herbaspirillum sp. CF444 TaxID=1144319 RepID=UPI0002722CF6|nr:ABC transporter permease [Herbaspirillum sp. CF444]EJL94489.1 ABC-2 type transporter, NodJ family [Herbaspirillum sp. CF444]